MYLTIIGIVVTIIAIQGTDSVYPSRYLPNNLDCTYVYMYVHGYTVRTGVQTCNHILNMKVVFTPHVVFLVSSWLYSQEVLFG